MSCLYILEINPLSIDSLSNIFSHSEGCLFVLFSFLCCAKAFKFHQIPFVYFCFYFHYSRRWVTKVSCCDLCQRVFFRCFALRRFIVSSLTFRSLNHFQFIFVYGVRECSNFILLHVAVQFSQHHLQKRLSFLHCVFLSPLSQVS